MSACSHLAGRTHLRNVSFFLLWPMAICIMRCRGSLCFLCEFSPLLSPCRSIWRCCSPGIFAPRCFLLFLSPGGFCKLTLLILPLQLLVRVVDAQRLLPPIWILMSGRVLSQCRPAPLLTNGVPGLVFSIRRLLRPLGTGRLLFSLRVPPNRVHLSGTFLSFPIVLPELLWC
jgi:hypothetical protein